MKFRLSNVSFMLKGDPGMMALDHGQTCLKSFIIVF